MKFRSNVCRVFGLAACLGVASDVSFGQEDALASQEFFDRIVWQFSDLESVSFQSDVSMVVHTEDPDEEGGGDIAIKQIISGAFMYKAHGDMWYRSSRMDPELYPGMDTEVAYDGQWYQYHRKDAGVMSVSSQRGDKNTTGMSLMNPLFLLAQPFMPYTDTGEDILLREIRDAASVYIADGPQQWEPVLTSEGKALRSTFAGSTMWGVAYETLFSIVINDGHIKAVVIETVQVSDIPEEDGAPLARIIFTDFGEFETPAGRTHVWPQSVSCEAYDISSDSKKPAAVFTMSIEDIELGGNAAGRFTLDWNAAEKLWLDDGSLFAP